MEDSKPRVIFMPGDFDDFTGTQEELDELIRIITSKVAEGTFQGDYSPDDSDYTAEEIEEMARVYGEERRRTLH